MSSKNSHEAGFVLASLVVLLGASCSVLETVSEEETHPLAFDHSSHVEDAEMECAECHTPEAEGAARMPTLETCGECHDVDDEDEETAVVELLTGLAKRPEGSRWFLYNTDEEIIFEHGNHSEVACATCHGDVGESEATDSSVVPSMELCVQCHEDSKSESAPGGDDCSGCHTAIRADIAPLDHKLSWETEHGRRARSRDMDGMMEGRCGKCHERDTCMECHKQVQPRDHTNFFRLRGHGLEVSNDRDTCANCHQTDMCVRCHENTVPISHRGSWGAPSNQHCVGCHEPVRTESSCAVCHKTSPSHAAFAPGLPSGHRFFTTDCRSCHGSTAALLHPDTGASCLACHQ